VDKRGGRGFGAVLALALAASGPVHAGAPASVSISSTRIRLADVLPQCPKSACDVDLGPAPPVGASRLVAVADMQRAVESAGHDAKSLVGLEATRVTSAARTLSPAEIASEVRPVVEAALPAGVTLTGLEPKGSIVLPLRAAVGTCSLASMPKRAGPIASTALCDYEHDGALARRVPVLVRVVMSAQAARPLVPRGHVLTLVIERRSATISTQGVALKDAELGEIAQFKVQRTGRVLSARVQADGTALVVEAQ
jgi:hypothetical protein